MYSRLQHLHRNLLLPAFVFPMLCCRSIAPQLGQVLSSFFILSLYHFTDFLSTPFPEGHDKRMNTTYFHLIVIDCLFRRFRRGRCGHRPAPVWCYGKPTGRCGHRPLQIWHYLEFMRLSFLAFPTYCIPLLSQTSCNCKHSCQLHLTWQVSFYLARTFGHSPRKRSS